MLKEILATLGILSGASFLSGASPNVLFEEHFDNPESINAWQAKGGGAAYDPELKAVKFTSVKPGEDYLIFHLDENKLRGRRIQFEAMVRGKDLSQSATVYFNSKLKISFDSNSGCERNPEPIRKSGTYDWRKASRVFFIPEDASNIKITLGLQDITGTYWVKNLRILELPVYPGQPYTPSPEPLQQNPKYRGIDTAIRAWTEQHFIDLKKWNVNIIRYQMLPYGKSINTREKFSAWIELEMKNIDAFLVLAGKYGMRAVLDLQIGPGMDNSELGSNKMSWDIKDQDLLVEIWRRMAGHYKGNRTVYAYDILNEPREEDFVYDPDGGVEWQLLVEKVIEAIRKIDPDTTIIVEATSWSNPQGFLNLKPVNGRNLIYSPHFYSPHIYTHQGIRDYKQRFKYPGKIGNEYWDKERLRKELEPVIVFQKKYNVPIYIGEFSAVRWAEGADQWLNDIIDLFEEYGWDWSYHSFREYHGWSVEHGQDQSDNSLKKTTPRKEVLLNYFKLNVQPEDGQKTDSGTLSKKSKQ